MATYYSSSNTQREVSPAIYPRDSMCTSYSEAQVLPNNMIMYLNQASSSNSYSGGSFPSDLPSSFGLWRDGRNELSFMEPMGGGGGTTNLQPDSCGDNEIPQALQIKFSEYLHPGSNGDNHNEIKGGALNSLQCQIVPKSMSTIPNSKYLKAAQQLLDEVVNVRKALKRQESNRQHNFQRFGFNVSKEAANGECKDGGGGGGAVAPTNVMPVPPPNQEESNTNPAQELSPAERHDLQNKISKLVSMLDEVDRRYKQYYHQMQILVSSFDVISGNGASKPYTALALQTISRHFRCLRDAISGQIKSIRTNLGEQDTAGNNVEGGISRLRFVDQQLRQQRALQQLGMMQQHAWRPQRGLPESAVSILRAWLFEHFLHPYPKDSDKIMLARQTGLTRGQVANWFINARVRLWKPMIEEMYKEEFGGETHGESNSSSDNAPKAATKDAIVVSQDNLEELQQNMNPAGTEKHYPGEFNESKLEDTGDVEVSGPTDYERPDMVSCSLPLQDTLVHSDGSGDGRFMDAAAAYQMAEMGRFSSHSGVSLTLGLQHFDNSGLPMSEATHHDNFLSMRGVEMYDDAAGASTAADFNCMDADNQRHRFGTSHLLHDFCSLR